LEAAGLAESVLPVLLPREWLAPHAPVEVPFRLLPRLQASWRVSPAAAGGATLHLIDWRAPLIGRVGASSTDPSGGIQAVDAWAVQTGWRRGAPFAPQVWAYRTRRHPQIATRLTLTPPERGLVLVKAWDAFGQEGTAVFAAPPAGAGEGTRKSKRR
jgi:hypothetical protein